MFLCYIITPRALLYNYYFIDCNIPSLLVEIFCSARGCGNFGRQAASGLLVCDHRLSRLVVFILGFELPAR
jgi:hypothetical protein